MAIEAMKRKIEAKMKTQGLQSQDVAQQIAMNIVDKNESPSTTPTLNSPETTINGSNNGPVSRSTPETKQPAAIQELSSITATPVDEEDEEALILAELEAERRAEEQARLKRQLLEDRLRNARGKTRSMSAVSEKSSGLGENVKDSMSISE